MKALDGQAQEWKDALMGVMEKVPAGACLALSGGMDSSTLLAALLELGRRPECWTFMLGDAVSSDLKAAKAICDENGLKLNVTKIPRSNLVVQVMDIINAVKSTGKAAVQCAHPVLWMCREMKSRGFGHVVMGTYGIVDDDKHTAILLAEKGEEACLEWRKREPRISGGVWAMDQAARVCWMTPHDPYGTRAVLEAGWKIPMKEINSPRQKGIALRAFPDFFKDGRWWRRNAPMQVGTGIREWHDELLRDPSVNVNGRKAIASLYADMAGGVMAQGSLL